MTEEDPTVEVELPYSQWLIVWELSSRGLRKLREDFDDGALKQYKEAHYNFNLNLEEPEGHESVIEKHGLQDAMRQAMSGRIKEFQPIVDDDTVFCEKCDGEYDWTPSVLSIHNMRRHEYHPDTYNYENWECHYCGTKGKFERATGILGTENLRSCSECGELQ